MDIQINQKYTLKTSLILHNCAWRNLDILTGHKIKIWIKIAWTTKPFVLVYSEGFVPDHFSPQTSWPALWWPWGAQLWASPPGLSCVKFCSAFHPWQKKKQRSKVSSFPVLLLPVFATLFEIFTIKHKTVTRLRPKQSCLSVYSPLIQQLNTDNYVITD